MANMWGGGRRGGGGSIGNSVDSGGGGGSWADSAWNNVVSGVTNITGSGGGGGGYTAPTNYGSYSAPAPTYSGGGGGYSYSPPPPPQNYSGYVQPVAPPPPPPPPPSINEFLGDDTGYQSTLRALANAMSNMKADVTRRRGDINTRYGVTEDAMQEQKVEDLDNIEEDYGARGIFRSGLYGKAVGDYNEEFGERMSGLERRQTNALDALASEMNKFKSQQKLKKQESREAAIARRAEEYGL